jgi:hypothetical protein
MAGRRTAAEHQIVQVAQWRQATWDTARFYKKKGPAISQGLFRNGNLVNYLKEIS